jgi:hypothetical protein
MYRGKSSRLFPIILVLIIVGIIIVALVSIGRAIFGGGGESDSAQTDTSRQALLSTSLDRSVRMTVRGPIVANEQFKTYRISVTPDSRNLTVYSGYLEQVTDNKAFGNNTKAYEEFVYALDKAELMNGTAFTGDEDDTRGICATGYVYEFEALQSDSTSKRLWASTCKGSKGSLDASLTQVRNLFTKQVPDTENLISDVDF